ncbi:Putative allophanate hydrolase [Mycobacteroides abscessus]|nr:Putative allophanate hydrolase [Mycobacteroides abscessus]
MQVWNHQHPDNAGAFEPGTPWLLRFFDQINWYPVSGEELVELRDELATGRGNGGVTITEGEFSMAGYSEFLAHNAASIGQFRDHQRLAYAAEREAWSTAGEFARI